MWGEERNWATSPVAICQKLQGMLTSSVCLTREAHVYVPNGENQGAHSACPQVGDRG